MVETMDTPTPSHRTKQKNIALSGTKGGKLQSSVQQHPKTKGGNHHTATKQKTIAHSGTKGGKLQSSDQQHPKTKGGNHHTATKQKTSHIVEPRVGNSSQVTNNTPKPRVETSKSREPKAKS
jgi:hypothetical protein